MPVYGKTSSSVPSSVDLLEEAGLLMWSTPSGCCWRGTGRRTSQYTCPSSTSRRHSLTFTCPGTLSGIPSTLTAPPKSTYSGSSFSTPTPPASSSSACTNCSRSPLVCTKDPSSLHSCSSFAWKGPRWIFRYFSPWFLFKDYFWCFVFIMIRQWRADRKLSGRERGGGDWERSSSWDRTRDVCNAMTLYVDALPIWLSAPTALVTSIRYLPSWQNRL